MKTLTHTYSKFSLCIILCSILCLAFSCKKNPATQAPTNVDFTLDLTSSDNLGLQKNGGYEIKNNILIIRYDNGPSKRFYAVQASCTYGQCLLMYDASDIVIQCNCHGCLFDVSTGTVEQGPATVPLGVYLTTLTVNSLRIHSA